MKLIIAILAAFLFIYAARLIELSTQSGRYQAYWQRSNNQPAKENEMLYIALGDSTAQGIGADKPQNSYVGYIARQLEAKYDRPLRVLNFSKSGARISDLADNQLPKLEQYNISKDTVITIEIGANDMSRFDAAIFQREMDELMRQLPRQTVISDIPYFKGGAKRSLEPNVIKANEIMYKLAGKYGFELAELHERTKNNSGPRTFAADWFHPSSYGYKTNWAHVFMERINER